MSRSRLPNCAPSRIVTTSRRDAAQLRWHAAVCDECERGLVRRRLERDGWENDVDAVERAQGNRGAIRGDTSQAPSTEINDDIARIGSSPANGDAPDGAVRCRHIEREIIADIADGRSSMASEADRDAWPGERLRL